MMTPSRSLDPPYSFDSVSSESAEHHQPTQFAPRPALTLVDCWLANRSAKTVEAYSFDIGDFAKYLGARDVEDAASRLLRCAHGDANRIVLSYRADLLARGLSTATVNRRISAIRSLVRLAQLLGLVAWTIDVPCVFRKPYRDTRGPNLEAFERVVKRVREREDAKGRRDYAILRLLFDLGLRRAELVALDIEDLEEGLSSIWIVGKGRRDRERMSLPEPTRDAIRDWLKERGGEPGALFLCLHKHIPDRLTASGVYVVIRELGKREGIKLTPHGIRHAAITTALDGTRDLRSVQRFSRHRDPKVVMVYDDNRADLAGEVSSLVASKIG